MLRTLAASTKLLTMLFLSALLAGPQIVLLKTLPLAHHGLWVLPRLWHACVSAAFGIRLTIIGTPCRDKRVLYVANHVSYLDIPVLGSLLNAGFVAKSEVAGWPLFGLLSKLQNTAYVSRTRGRAAISDETSDMDRRVDAGCSLILFPEGTNTQGDTILPFKSTFFTLAEKRADITLQPVTIRILSTDRRRAYHPLDRIIYGWAFIEDMFPHLWRFARHGGARLEITFHDPVRTGGGQDRKTLAKLCFDRVSKPLTTVNFDQRT